MGRLSRCGAESDAERGAQSRLVVERQLAGTGAAVEHGGVHGVVERTGAIAHAADGLVDKGAVVGVALAVDPPLLDQPRSGSKPHAVHRRLRCQHAAFSCSRALRLLLSSSWCSDCSARMKSRNGATRRAWPSSPSDLQMRELR